MSKKFLSPIKLAQGTTNPATGSAGELFFNTTDVKVYAHNGTTWVPSGGGVTVSATAPSTPIAGDAWYDTVDGTLYVYYNDGDSSQWVEVAANSGISVALEGRLGVVETYVTTLQTEMDTVEARATSLETEVRAVSLGGTGASTLTGGGYLKGNGTSAISAQTGIPATDITSGVLPYSTFPAGAVLQVVQTIYSSHATISSGTDTAFINFSGLDTTVVPKRANSKFLIRYQINIGAYSSSIRAVLKINGGYYNTIYTDGYRASTNSIFGGGGLPYSATINAFTGEYLFTNSASNNVAIGFEIVKQDPNYNAYVNRAYGYTDPQRGYPTSTVTIMEIAG